MLHADAPSRLRKGILLMDEGMLAAGYGIADDLPDPLPGEIGIREDDDTLSFSSALIIASVSGCFRFFTSRFL